MTTRRVRIVLQARTGSRRLPAKSLLPLAGLPLAVLCAYRLGSTGREVVLATSDTAGDDLLAALAAEHGIRTYRGSLDDVLGRYLGCIADLHADDIVVRATADNPIPDGEFVDQLIRAFDESGARYLGSSANGDGLPFGLSAEVFTAGALREAAQQRRDPYVNEHVTPHLRATAGRSGIVPRGLLLEGDHSHLRVTIDTLEDYLTIAALFRRVAGAERAPWRTLIEAMAEPGTGRGAIDGKCVAGKQYSCLTLGTAQLGMHYGITNATGRPNDSDALAIVVAAIDGGIRQIDTARAYGDAELRIGRILSQRPGNRLRVISKLTPLTDLPDEATRAEVHGAVDRSLDASRQHLGRSQLEVLMLHRCADMFRWHGAALERLADHKRAGTVGEIGVSVYTPQEAVRCLDDERVTQLQIPFNLLDRRWLEPEFQTALAVRHEVAVHARSVFLQGLLLSDAAHWPAWAETAPTLCAEIRHLTGTLGRKSAADLCIAFVRACPWITSLVVGVETEPQLKELLLLTHEAPLNQTQTETVCASFNNVSERLLNPSLW